jgi:hypothetical protein
MVQPMTQRAAATVKDAAQRLAPVVKTRWRMMMDANAEHVQKEEPTVLAKRLLFTSLAQCVPTPLARADTPIRLCAHLHRAANPSRNLHRATCIAQPASR